MRSRHLALALGLTASSAKRPGAQVGELEPIQLDGLQFHRVDLSWTDDQFGVIHQLHVFASLPREDALQDFVHVTGSAGGHGGDADRALVEQVILSTRVTR